MTGLSTLAARLRAAMLYTKFRNPNGMRRGKNVSFYKLRQISWGNAFKAGDFACFKASSNSGITIGDNVSIGSFCKLVTSQPVNPSGGYIKIVDNVSIGDYSYLDGSGGLTIGRDYTIGQHFNCNIETQNINDVLCFYTIAWHDR